MPHKHINDLIDNFIYLKLIAVDVMSLMLMSSPRITSNGSQLNETFPMFWQCAEVPKNYESFVDLQDGYSYFYPSDWIVSYELLLQCGKCYF